MIFITYKYHAHFKLQVYQAGNGKKVRDNSQVWLHYIGFIEHSKEPFDSTKQRKKLFTFKLTSDACLCHGLNLGVRSMEFNEVSLFMITPNYAYGPLGCPPRIPPSKNNFYIKTYIFSTVITRSSFSFMCCVQLTKERLFLFTFPLKIKFNALIL